MPAIPTLIEYLKDKYDEAVEKATKEDKDRQQKKRRNTGGVNPGVDSKYTRLNLMGVTGFTEFCEKVLAENPVAGVWYPGVGVGLTLANGDRVVMTSAGKIEQLPGQMEASHDIPVTDGKGEGSIPI